MRGSSRAELTAIVITQNTHLHPFASHKNPPATGPITGPIKGPIAQIDIAFPLLSCRTISAIVPPPIVKGAEPTHPSRKRKASSMFMSVLTAHAIVKTTKSTLHVW